MLQACPLPAEWTRVSAGHSGPAGKADIDGERESLTSPAPRPRPPRQGLLLERIRSQWWGRGDTGQDVASLLTFQASASAHGHPESHRTGGEGELDVDAKGLGG